MWGAAATLQAIQNARADITRLQFENVYVDPVKKIFKSADTGCGAVHATALDNIFFFCLNILLPTLL